MMALGAVVPESDLPKLGAEVPDHDLPDSSSVMNPNPVSSRLREIGKTIGKYDPTVPSNLPRTAPLAAGMAVSGAASATGNPLIAAAGGAAAPYVEAGVSKALGGNPQLPTWQDVVKNAAINAAFEGVGGAPAREGATEVGSTMEKLPSELQNVKNMRQTVRNRSLWEGEGMSGDQIDAMMANPDNAAAHLKSSIEQANKIKDSYQTILDTTRARFEGRYNSAYGAIAQSPVEIAPVQQAFDQASKIGAEHELTPQWKNFLQRKANELAGEDVQTVARPGDIIQRGNTKGMEPGMRAQFEAQSRGITDNQELIRIADEARAKAEQGSSGRTFQGLRDIRTELRENKPTNGTPLDLKAYSQVEDTLTKQIDSEGRRLGLNEEKIGQMHGIDADYSRFKATTDALDPRSEKFGAQTADAMFKAAQENPELGLQFVQMAKNAGKLPEFREQFLNNLIQKASTEGGPINEMKYLRKFQDTWRDSKAGEAVLNQTFGKDSALANPITMSRVLGAATDESTKSQLSKTMGAMVNSPWMLRMALFASLIHGSPFSVYSHPDRAIPLLLGIAGLKVASRLEPAAQSAYVRMVTNPTSVEAVKNFSRIAGATITGLESTPQPSQ